LIQKKTIMSGKSIFSYGIEPISCHAWNGDRTKMALSPNNHEVHIYTYIGGNWEKTDTLSEHYQRVTGIDWAPNSNRIVTGGADRNAYVWVEHTEKGNNGRWKPTLVILRINRAATCVRWSPCENKFAVGSGARLISVCYFEKENDWWVSKHIKKPLRSTVTCLDWHPNNVLVAAGSTDFKARIFSAYVKEVEEKPQATVWGKKMTFGNLMAEFSSGGGGWVNDVSFTASGERLAWIGHDASINVVDAANEMKLTILKTSHLPFMACSWLGQSSIIVAGHDCVPIVFLYSDDGQITFSAKLDKEGQVQAQKFTAMRHFQNLDTRAQSDTGTSIQTTHQNTITQVCLHTGDKTGATKVSTSGIDGKIVIWDLQTLESAIAGLRIV